MGNGMNKVLPGLFVGNYRDSKDQQQLDKFQITHIVAIHDSPRRLLPDKHYLCVMAADTPDQNLSQYFSVCNDFIHAARLRDGNVLIHCLAGMSRSVTVAVAYIMSATNLNWKEALKVVRAGRAVANPNVGFQTQLQEFEMFRLADERRRLKERFPSTALDQSDRTKCLMALDNYQELLQNKDICEGNCSRGEKCPTGNKLMGGRATAACGTPCKSTNEHSCKNAPGGIGYALYFIVENWRTLRTDAKNKATDLVLPPGKPMMENVMYYCPINQSSGGEYPGDNQPSTSTNIYPKHIKEISHIPISKIAEDSLEDHDDVQSDGLSMKTRSSIDRITPSSSVHIPSNPDLVSRQKSTGSVHSVQSQPSTSRRNTNISVQSIQSQSSVSRSNTAGSRISFSQSQNNLESEKRKETMVSDSAQSQNLTSRSNPDLVSRQKSTGSVHSVQSQNSTSRRNTDVSMQSIHSQSSVSRLNTAGSRISFPQSQNNLEPEKQKGTMVSDSVQSQNSTSRRNTNVSMQSIHSQSSVSRLNTAGSRISFSQSQNNLEPEKQRGTMGSDQPLSEKLSTASIRKNSKVTLNVTSKK